MAFSQNEYKIAILLNVLGEDVAKGMLEQLAPERGDDVQRIMRECAESPPTMDEVDDVLDDFHRFLRFAVESSGRPALRIARFDDGGSQGESDDGLPFPDWEPSGDPFIDVRRLRPIQIAGALQGENEKTIALVLSCLGSEGAGEVIQNLPSEVRAGVFLTLKAGPKASPPMLRRIVTATVEKGRRLDPFKMSDPQGDADRNLAQVLRSMDRGSRAELLAALQAADEETAKRVKAYLFTFEDILRVTDKTVQRLMAELDTNTLATALKGAAAEITQKMLGNLSKRARAALVEEIEFLPRITPPQEQEARGRLCEALVKLDAEGDLEMLEE